VDCKAEHYIKLLPQHNLARDNDMSVPALIHETLHSPVYKDI